MKLNIQRRSLGLLLCLLLFGGGELLAQRTITGTVMGDSGEPLIGVSILVAQTSSGTVTDFDGNYSLQAKTGSELIFSYTGYGAKTVVVGDESVINVTLEAGTDLDEVVVTALGIPRQRKALGYAVEELDDEEITQSRQGNLINAIQGKAAGVQISSAGGGPGQGARIIIRGINSLGAGSNNEPLFVIDGIPVTNETLSVGGGSGRNLSNRVGDLNPQDIESMSILKGGAATALYGLRAANGAVVITTKKGKAGKISFDLTSTYGTEEVNKFPEVQKTYTQGYGGNYDKNSFWPSWGPTVEEAQAIDPDHPAELFNNFENAFQTGNQWRNTLSVSGGNERAQFRTSLSHLDHEGVLPFSDYKNSSFRINANYSVNDKFSFGGGVNYIRSGGNRVNADRFSTRLVYWAPQADVNDYIAPDGSMRGYRYNQTRGNNPIYGEATNKFIDDVDRYIGNLRFNYSPFDFLSINYTLGMDQYTDFRQSYAQGPVYPGAPNFENNGDGYVTETGIRRRDLTSNINATLTHQLNNDIGVRLLGGFDVFDSSYDRTTTSGSELAIYNFFSLNNASTITTSKGIFEKRLLGLYGDLSFDYRNAVYLTITGRNDWTSTLPKENRSFFYPSVSLGFLLSDMLELPSAISYAKLRLSYAGIGKDTNPYRTSVVYGTDTPIDGVTRWSRGSQKGSNELKPERTQTVEIGTDLRFLDNRLGLDITYYNAESKDQIIPVPVSYTTGFGTFILNAGSIRNRGVELALNATPVRTKDFEWNLNINFTRNENEVLAITEGVEDILIGSSYGYAGSTSSLRLIVGQPYGNIYGTSYARYNPDAGPDDEPSLYIDEDAPILIGENGFPVRETNQKILGNSQPKWFGALNTSFSYRGLTLSALLDTRQGVQKYNQMDNYFSAFGIAPYTLNREETIVFDGVLADGTPNTKPVYLGQGEGPDGENYGAGYYRNTYRGITENFVEDADWVRLRTLSLSYELPTNLFANNFLEGANITLTGNNLWLSTPYSGFDPEGNRGNQNGDDGFGGFTYPNVRSFFVTLNANF